MVASFYLPVILTRRLATARKSPAACGGDCDGWTAEWDHEQLIALQVGCGTVS